MAELNDSTLELRHGLADLTPARILMLYRRAPLSRAVTDPVLVQKMFERATLVISAWQRGRLIGLARVLSDGVLFSYLCDLAVEPDVQGLGVGRKLIEEVARQCKGTQLILSDVGPNARLYERLGFARAGNAWVRKV
jgi:GNAT superfamily N-acetyltransferase